MITLRKFVDKNLYCDFFIDINNGQKNVNRKVNRMKPRYWSMKITRVELAEGYIISVYNI